MIELYKCEICGNTSEDKVNVFFCEGKGVPTPIVEIGQKIVFCDCELTPVLYDEAPAYLSRLPFDKEYNTYEKMLYHSHQYIDLVMELEIVNIKINGHEISYFLGRNNSPVFAYGIFTEKTYSYPEIKGNELMQKILDANYKLEVK